MKKKNIIKSSIMVGALALTIGSFSGVVFKSDSLLGVQEVHAVVNGGINSKFKSGDDNDGSQTKLREAVDDAVADNIYKGENDVDYKGKDLVKNGVTNDNATKLRRSEREKLFQNMYNESQKQIQKSKDAIRENPNDQHANVIDEGTQSNWLKDLQASPGMDSELITAVMGNFKADIVGGHRILAPFEGPLGTVMGVFVVLAMVLLMTHIAIDMAFLYSPLFQGIVTASASRVEQGSGGGKLKQYFTNYFVTREAIAALEEAGKGDSVKSPYMIYFRKKGMAMFAFALLLCYLASGSLWSIFGHILDLLRNFFN